MKCSAKSLEAEPALWPLEEALREIYAAIQPIRSPERVPLRECLGRVLANDVVSDLDIPSFRNSSMDGYAFRRADVPAKGTVKLRLIGGCYAGHRFSGEIGPGECIRIFTGGRVPDSADAVIPQEDANPHGDAVELSGTFEPDENIRQTGEEIESGSVILRKGRRLTPADIGILAALGMAEATVIRKPCVAIFATGDELRSIGEPLKPDELYDSNRYVVYTMLRELDVDIIDMGAIRDDEISIQSALREAAAMSDAVVTTGGASVGDADLVVRSVSHLGQVTIHRVAAKPGKPFAFGKISDAHFFGLPGNPVSAMVMLCELVKPALIHLMGAGVGVPLRFGAICRSQLTKSPGRQEFQRGVLSRGDGGMLEVTPCAMQGSHMLTSMSRANCFIVLAADTRGVAAGETVEVEPFTTYL
jgi:molybdopterin molybdotransferase